MTGDCRSLKQALNVLHFAPRAGHILDLPPPPAPSPRSNGGGDADATDTPPTAAPGGDTEAAGKLPVLSAGDWMRRGMLAERLGAGLGDGAMGQAALAYSCCCRCVESCVREWTREDEGDGVAGGRSRRWGQWAGGAGLQTLLQGIGEAGGRG